MEPCQLLRDYAFQVTLSVEQYHMCMYGDFCTPASRVPMSGSSELRGFPLAPHRSEKTHPRRAIFAPDDFLLGSVGHYKS